MRPTTIALAAVLATAVLGCSGSESRSLALLVKPCVRVIDGDTVVVQSDLGEERVRLVGIDCPETGDPRPELRRVSRLATEHVRERVSGEAVELHINPVSTRDAHGRLLAYVHREGVDIGADLVERGLATALTRFPHPRMDAYVRLERKAKADRLGVWQAPPSETPPFIASRNSRVFHHVTCPKAATIADRNRRWFDSREEAIGSGRRPCAHCGGEPFER